MTTTAKQTYQLRIHCQGNTIQTQFCPLCHLH